MYQYLSQICKISRFEEIAKSANNIRLTRKSNRISNAYLPFAKKKVSRLRKITYLCPKQVSKAEFTRPNEVKVIKKTR